ncbi:unnamed protein product (macronuclear) [Paramecium tetraurelia]|uniref:Cyclic nucleotide-binding domain-containing protein n=1 Tax=Paramecium tetraurelia TaxID=5888 RepID=A0BQF4_PARTE|nr:uncharacterized protein GSPATT00031000001 [Paramecium tetraurelia]CAK60771.1 unnamed protein product [Paramecium tetraurelia]|eukprot:XP_001428169.1 hypothetical protein (macronuclear) [Paramecium tetraurelia strain d4-2]
MQNQGTMTDLNEDDIRRLDQHVMRNPNIILSCIRVLKMEELRRTNEDNSRLMNFMRSHLYFKGSSSLDYLWECCQLMKFEQLKKNQIVYLRGRENQDQLVILLTGEMSVQSNEQELLCTKHFGSALIVFGNDSSPNLIVKTKSVCKAAVISKLDFKINMLTHEISKINVLLQQIYAFHLFRTLPFTTVKQFFLNSFTQHLCCQDTLYNQNQKASQVFLVISGIFELRETTETNTKSINIYTPGQLIGDFECVNFFQTRKSQALCISDEGAVLVFEGVYFLNQILPNIRKSFVSKRTNEIKQTQKSIQMKKTLQRIFPEQPIEQSISSQQQLNQTSTKHFRFAKLANPRFFKLKQTPEKQLNLQQNSLSINRSQQQLLTTKSHKKVSIVSFSTKQELFQGNIKGRLLRNELLNKFINQQSEYQDVVQKLRRTQSQLGMNK